MTQPLKPRSALRHLGRLLNNNWLVTVLGGLVVIFLTPLVTGFADLTFRTRSWEVFGIANDAEGPGTYLAPDAVYRIPLGDRFRIDGGLLFSARYANKTPYFSITRADGSGRTAQARSSSSVALDGDCLRAAVHLMRTPAPGDTQFFVMYTTQALDTPKCRGLFGNLFAD